ncbi:MAG: murein hydrolase activator EnvC family protein [Acidimicrobiia bacterium]
MTPVRLLRSAVALALLAGVGALAPVSGAQEDPDPKSRQELEEAIGHASAEETAALAEVEEVRARRADLEAVARQLEAQIAAATQRFEVAQREVDRIGADIAEVQAEIDRLQAEIDASQAQFEESAATLYRNGGGAADAISVLTFADDPGQGIAARRYMRQVAHDAQDEIDDYDALQDDVDAAKEELEAQQDLAEEARAVAEAGRAEVQRLRAEHEPARAAAEEEEAREEELLESVRARRAEFEAQLAQLEAEQQALAQGVSRGSGTGNGRFKWPCSGGVVSGFGNRTHPISGTSRMHSGVDINCANGAPISAAGDGVVVEAGSRGGYGNAVVIDHGDGLATLYAHQSSIAASSGQQVKTGDVIGYVGSTGYSTGPHLHWEVWVNGTPVDPLGYS